ncbi:MAG: cation:proton antiporter [Leptolyngbyaceae cyanobacterium bins.349]|nr:cation:proton antiporter [Leptolyngbyaceae cyanobacterium bins.349]
MIGQLILRLTLWFLLTANFSLTNIIIGIGIALLLPRQATSAESWQEWLRMLWKVLLAIPQAYMEAVELLFRPHVQEEVVMEQVPPWRSPGLIFLDIFLITFTPKTIVLNHHEDGFYEVHQVVRRRPRG